jgi:hypothetical protein
MPLTGNDPTGLEQYFVDAAAAFAADTNTTDFAESDVRWTTQRCAPRQPPYPAQRWVITG